MIKKIQGILLMSIIVILAACGDEEIKPVAIDEATDTCATCNMAVVDNQFATQIILKDGKSFIFDDIGCMYEWMESNEDKEVEAEFVRNYDDKEWVLADKATYVYNQSVKTPMAYNVISFNDSKEAEKYVAKHKDSTLMTAEELGDHSWERNHEMMKKMKEMNHGKGSDHSHSEDGEMEDSHSDGDM
ncbi:nitrous oxide reductase accessory protein NosL [Peribacillus sp. FSL H8-0477]|uniref:nitrous oxide reductase accessory protein NosL n=1 Tax=Peribacillus sp. FSL H8-0477 TaxID=2921388 RepID=UPI0030FACC96